MRNSDELFNLKMLAHPFLGIPDANERERQSLKAAAKRMEKLEELAALIRTRQLTTAEPMQNIDYAISVLLADLNIQ